MNNLIIYDLRMLFRVSIKPYKRFHDLDKFDANFEEVLYYFGEKKNKNAQEFWCKSGSMIMQKIVFSFIHKKYFLYFTLQPNSCLSMKCHFFQPPHIYYVYILFDKYSGKFSMFWRKEKIWARFVFIYSCLVHMFPYSIKKAD